MVRIGEEHRKIGRRHCSTLARIRLKGGYKMEMHHSNTYLSIYGMGDAPTFIKKEMCPLS
jgi:hypothetical protein